MPDSQAPHDEEIRHADRPIAPGNYFAQVGKANVRAVGFNQLGLEQPPFPPAFLQASSTNSSEN